MLASTALSALDATASTSASLCQLVSINGSLCTGNLSTLSTAELSASLNVLQMLTTEAEVANGTHALDLGTSLGITGVTDAKLKLTVGQIPQVAFGPVGTTASTAQLTTDLQLNDGLPRHHRHSPLGRPGYGHAHDPDLRVQRHDCNQHPTDDHGGHRQHQALLGVVLASISVSGVNSGNTSPLGYGPSVVPPTATTAANDTNPASIPTFTTNSEPHERLAGPSAR